MAEKETRNESKPAESRPVKPSEAAGRDVSREREYALNTRQPDKSERTTPRFPKSDSD